MNVATASRPGRAPSVDFEEVVSAAVAVADAHGLKAVTFRALARELNVSAMAVHRATGGIDRLQHAIVSRSVGDAARDVEWPPDWADVVRLFAERLRALLLRHPAVLEAHRRAPLDTPEAASVVAVVLAALERAGLDQGAALDAYQAVHDYVTGHVAMQLGRREDVALGSPRAPASQRALPDRPDYERRFAVGIDLLMTGIEARTAEPRPHQDVPQMTAGR
ncbi:MAG: TetR/AcrR family transcriptional regulator C-terminal domain-containing protein [Actinobacteria bacterium]|nr:TetR/AcrR family transcriptional regulator C-terminal domain-containing protein [Actinomycetota bacterium]MCA1720808.1 TetR/AcrR family transcriptional regulator C-terminal domain-containing protein [Actinomycetota bacterium]